jgi:hydroxymethylbilane synthase
VQGDTLQLTGLVAAPDGTQVIRQHCSGPRLRCEQLGVQLAERVLAMGADRLLATLQHA